MGPVWNLEEPVCQTTPYMLKLREPRCKTAVLQQSSSAGCKTTVVQDKPIALTFDWMKVLDQADTAGVC